MNGLSVYRTFAKPGYSPVKGKVRIFDDKWYIVTFQNTETDQGDGHYLVDGEYTQLMPGRAARNARDAHLNHCNAVSEHKGPVYAVCMKALTNLWPYVCEYAESLAEAHKLAARKEEAGRVDYARAIEAIDKTLNQSDAELIAFYGQCRNWPGNEARELAKLRAEYRKRRESSKVFLAPVTIETVRA